MEEYECGYDGTVLEKTGSWNGTVSSSSSSSIYNELKLYPFDDEILNTADRIHSKMKKRTRRGNIRVQLRYHLIYCAHLELGRSVDPIALGRIFSLTPSQVQKCDSLFSPIQTGYTPPKFQDGPGNYLSGYCNEVPLTETATRAALELCSEIMHKSPSLYEENPRTVAAGILKYYISTNGIVIPNPELLSTITERSNATIIQMYKKIAAVDNM